jgi:hypothetical protein
VGTQSTSRILQEFKRERTCAPKILLLRFAAMAKIGIPVALSACPGLFQQGQMARLSLERERRASIKPGEPEVIVMWREAVPLVMFRMQLIALPGGRPD